MSTDDKAASQVYLCGLFAVNHSMLSYFSARRVFSHSTSAVYNSGRRSPTVSISNSPGRMINCF